MKIKLLFITLLVVCGCKVHPPQQAYRVGGGLFLSPAYYNTSALKVNQLLPMRSVKSFDVSMADSVTIIDTLPAHFLVSNCGCENNRTSSNYLAIPISLPGYVVRRYNNAISFSEIYLNQYKLLFDTCCIIWNYRTDAKPSIDF